MASIGPIPLPPIGGPIQPIDPEDPPTSDDLPGWVTNLKPLATASGAVAFLVAFAKNPVEMIRTAIFELFIGVVLDATTYLSGVIDQVWSPIISIPGTVLGPIVGQGGVVWEVTWALGQVAYTLRGTLLTVAELTGPAAPVVTLLLWVGVGVAITWLLSKAVQAVPLVVPWL